ncbi:hypothetical protein EAH_00041210 [Eimeria acervulina]|uniref:Uncharacterized protein n=1 Tax=Eimeria acervulina TaxID=5801 RepID=U6GVN1_EIMAC|nr:hypothetical protein EAH_00041210 [Eimeria acervulina]CDI83632.1 hypothetical protein EAH_00041210 [Eimeria acervulina]
MEENEIVEATAMTHRVHANATIMLSAQDADTQSGWLKAACLDAPTMPSGLYRKASRCDAGTCELAAVHRIFSNYVRMPALHIDTQPN